MVELWFLLCQGCVRIQPDATWNAITKQNVLLNAPWNEGGTLINTCDIRRFRQSRVFAATGWFSWFLSSLQGITVCHMSHHYLSLQLLLCWSSAFPGHTAAISDSSRGFRPGSRNEQRHWALSRVINLVPCGVLCSFINSHCVGVFVILCLLSELYWYDLCPLLFMFTFFLPLTCCLSSHLICLIPTITQRAY